MNRRRFTTLWIYTILKRTFADRSLSGRFTTLWIYTILKLKSYSQNIEYRFTTLWIYTILKRYLQCTDGTPSFTTLWIYTILKLTIKDLAIDISFTTLWIYTILKPCREPPRRRPQFHYLMDLHYSQTLNPQILPTKKFHYLMDLHYSQTRYGISNGFFCFTTLWIYTILKRFVNHLYSCVSFTTLWIYTILKPQISCAHYTAQGKSTRSSTIVLWRNGIVKGTQISIQHIEFGAHIYAHRCLAL